MADDLVSRHTVEQVLGRPRLLRFIRAGWLSPAQRTPSRVLFRVSDVHAALRRLERGEVCPPDQIESARINGSARRHGRGYVKKVRPIPKLDFTVPTRKIRFSFTQNDLRKMGGAGYGRVPPLVPLGGPPKVTLRSGAHLESAFARGDTFVPRYLREEPTV
jgi:hypothetical protein